MMNMSARFARFLQMQNAGQILSLARLMSFQSSLSLKKLYPTSNITITTPSQVPSNPDKKFNGIIPLDQLNVSYSRSSGPGGQHVNKTNSKVEIRFHIDKATWIHDELRARVKEQYKNRITKEGFFLITSEKTRSQQLNMADCLDRLRTIIYEVEALEKREPSPEEHAVILKRLERANRERLKEKRMRSLTKHMRHSHDLD